MLQTSLQIFVFIVTVLVLVTIHEFGHFWVAKRLGIKVLKFSVGFGRPLIRWQGKGETEYVIAWIPLGGYVKLLDERETPNIPDDQKPFAFNRQSLWKRSLVVVAGPGINILFAILCFWSVWFIGMERIKPVIGEVIPLSIAEQSGLQQGQTIVAIDKKLVDSWGQVSLGLVERLGETGKMVIAAGESETPGIHVYNLAIDHWRVDGLNPDPLKSLGIVPYRPAMPPVIEKVAAKTPAAEAGFEPGDKIILLNGIAIDDWSEVLEYVQAHPQTEMHFAVLRDGKTIPIIATSDRRLSGFHWIGFLGLQSTPPVWSEDMRYTVQLSASKSFYRALADTWDYTAFHFIVIKKLVVGEISISSLGGPIAIYQVTSRAFHEGLVIYIAFLGLISVMLACVNILPIPGLDGGHLVFFLVEAIIKKPVSVPLQALIFRIGFILLAVLIFHATVNDLMRLAG
jgi:regulator of sigma E protease